MTQWDVQGATVWPVILVGAGSGGQGPAGRLSGTAADCLVRVEVDTQLLLPGMFTLAFEDLTGAALDDAGLDIGVGVEVRAGPAEEDRLVVGEVTAVEGYYQGTVGRTVVRGYDLCHRLQRARRTRSFDNVTDADIARRIAEEAGLTQLDITPTRTVHEHVLQCNQSDWEFLTQRAAEIGFEVGMDGGRFRFRPGASVSAGTDGTAVELAMPGGLLRFEPRVSAGNLTPDVEVRVWDPLRAALADAPPAPTRAAGVSAARPRGLAEVAGLFRPEGGGLEDAALDEDRPAPGQDRGPAPSPTAHVVGTLPVADAEAAASALAASVGGTFAEAEGDAVGNPAIRSGGAVTVTGIAGRFPRTWLVTRARHVFDLAEHGYHTEFAAGGLHDRSLLGLTSAGTGPIRVPGLVCAVVDDIGDDHARVRLTLPWLSPDARTDWAPVVQFGAGRRSGAMFLPEVGDQVLVGFEFGDPRRPYVLGGLVTEDSAYSLGGDAIQRGPGGADSSVVRRGFVSASGSGLVFHDEMGEGPEPVTSQLTLGSGDGTFGLAIDAVAGAVELACAPADPDAQLTIRCGQAGTVNIQTGPGGCVNIDGGDTLTLTSAASLTIKSDGSVSVSAPSITLGG
ncbi:phage baseplate assembly protein V [Streptacidiphilus melanogenes]|uniref:phage baseplate assembly protein V n=1 Tax=Streptacidiphilus melanogenes TaxID=411235 RepID=UPI000693925F|nr:phage baseplate assembly protein V [Streptacidiphilus melanogenes]